MLRRLLALGALALAVLVATFLWTWRDAPLAGSGWVAKRICSAVFVAGRDPASVVEASIPLPVDLPVPYEIDRPGRTVTARVFGGLAPSTARHRPGLGCTLDDPDGGPSPLDGVPAPPVRTPGPPLPERPTPPPLAAAIAPAFEGARDGLGTRAVVVLHRGALVAERYAPGFDAGTRLAGWSMTKSVTSAMVGLLADTGRIDVFAPVGLAEWPEGDPRAAITWDHLLRMSSGLAFEEDYETPTAHAIRMLFSTDRFARGRYAASMPLEHPIDTFWSYSSGTSNLLQYAILERVFDGDLAAYLRFPGKALFGPTGMASAVLEPDASGAYVGSSHLFATARDWARFGQLYLDRGVANGRRVLSEAWVDYTARPTPTARDGVYGAHWWLNADPLDGQGERRWPSLPNDVLVASGFEGQSVVVVPRDDLVVVRLGVDRGERLDVETLVARARGALGLPGN